MFIVFNIVGYQILKILKCILKIKKLIGTLSYLSVTS